MESKKEKVVVETDPLVRDRRSFEDLLKRRYFVSQAFEIYGGVAGLYDFGPPGTAMKNNFLSLWRQMFVLEENMLELECTCLTPYQVLKASGHVDRFSDFMVRDTVTNECYRADKLLEDFMDKLILEETDAEKIEKYRSLQSRADDFNQEELGKVLSEYQVESENGNPITEPFPFNLMFGTSIGPAGNLQGFLRPETAQGIFVNFRRLLDFNGNKLPFGGAMIGQAFRNEIAPRAGLLRVREFTLAEIEYFVHPNKRDSFPKFYNVKDVEAFFLPRNMEVSKMNVHAAVEKGIISNETLGYFIGRTSIFLERCGLKKSQYRFRQHRENEMAHYANDCWDAEIRTSYGWIECIGIADRSCYDLTCHSTSANVEMTAYETYPEPIMVEELVAKFNNRLMGMTFKKNSRPIIGYVNGLSQEEKRVMSSKISENDSVAVTVTENDIGEVTLTKDMVSFQTVKKKVAGESFIPSVIEPSFGVGRILYGILERSFWVREGDEQRGVLSLAPCIAPYKCGIFPLLSNNKKFAPLIEQLRREMTALNVSTRVDDSGTAIGRRYARADELGVPFVVTLDIQSFEDGTVTLRERDSCTQVRLPMTDAPSTVEKLCSLEGTLSWAEVQQRYPEQSQTASALVGKGDE